MPIKLNDTTWKEIAKDNPKDLVEVIIGDDKQPDFKPQIKIQRWDNEVNCSIRLKDDSPETPIITTEGEKIKFIKNKIEAHFYDIPIGEKHPEGGYEFEIVLKEKPAINRIEFTLNTKGVDFFYQSELTKEEKDQGAVRPENVIGSYAVYTSEQKTNWVGEKEYKCGKVGHIYRPKIIDSAGTEVWGELNIDIEKGLLTISIPQEFLDNAIYPIRHAAGLTFGYTTRGTTLWTNIVDYITGSIFTGVAGIGVSMTAWLYATAAGLYKYALYNGTAFVKGTNEGTTGTSGIQELTQNFTSQPALTAIPYTLVAWGDVAATIYIYGDNGDVNQGLQKYVNYGDWPDPFSGASANNYKFSIYCTYTAGGTAALTGTATAGITETDVVTGGKTIIITLTGDTWIA